MRITICVSAYHFATSPHKIDVPYITQSNFLVVYYLIAEGNLFMKLCTLQIIPKLRIHAKKIDLPLNKGRNYGPRWEKLVDYFERIHYRVLQLMELLMNP